MKDLEEIVIFVKVALYKYLLVHHVNGVMEITVACKIQPALSPWGILMLW